MSRALRTTVEARATVPGILPRLVIIALGASAFVLAPLPLAWVAFALAVAGAFVPRTVGCWLSAGVILLAQLLHPMETADARPFAVLLIVHVLHVSGALSLVVDWRGGVQARALAPALRRLLVIQIPAAAVLAVVLAFGQWRLPPVAAAVVALLAACATAATIALIVLPRRGVRVSSDG